MSAACQVENNWITGGAGAYLSTGSLPYERENSPKQFVTPPFGHHGTPTKLGGEATILLWVLAKDSMDRQDSMDRLLVLVDAPANRFSRASLKVRVLELQKMAASENWDGEGAVPLDQETVEHATQFIDCLPAELPCLDVDASPHGTIDFEWVLSRQAMLSVSMCPDNTIAFAARFPEERTRSSTDWSKAIPDNLMIAIKRLQQEHGMVRF